MTCKIISMKHVAPVSKDNITPDQVLECLKNTMSQSMMAQVKQHNYFGVGRDLQKELLNHTSLLIKLVSIDTYPKLLVLQAGIDLWAVHLGLVVADLPDCWSKHQAFALFQLLSKARKVAHNATTSGRQDAALKPLIQLLKETSKKRPPTKVDIAKTAMGPKARKLVRRTSSSPGSVKTAKSKKLSSEEMDAIFGSASGSASTTLQDVLVDLVTPTSSPHKVASAELPTPNIATSSGSNPAVPASEPSSSTPFLNFQEGKKQMVLPSGEVVDLPMQEKKKIVMKKPTSSATSSSTLRMTTAHTRKAAYITMLVEGKPKLLVELTSAKTPKWKEHTEFILGELEGKLSENPGMSFEVLKQHALDMRAQLYK